jgi:threonine/homoserine/homoserine lactone efflux protein
MLRVAGACNLVGLGLAPVLAEVSRHAARLVSVRASWADPVCRSGGTIRGAFAAGLLSELLNPNIGLFYVSVVPQFVPAGRPRGRASRR